MFPPPKPGQLVGPSSDPAAPKGLLFSHIVKPIMYFVIFLVLRYAVCHAISLSLFELIFHDPIPSAKSPN